MAKYCTHCGSEMNDDAVVCIHCGRSNVANNTEKDSDSKSWWCLGFFTSLFCTPIIGLILWLVWREEAPMKAKQVGLGTLWSLLASVIISIIAVIIYFCVIASFIGASGMAIAPILGAIGLLA